MDNPETRPQPLLTPEQASEQAWRYIVNCATAGMSGDEYIQTLNLLGKKIGGKHPFGWRPDDLEVA